MDVDQLRYALNRTHQLLDEAESAKREDERDAKVLEALRVSERALEGLFTDPSLPQTLSDAAELTNKYRAEMRAIVSDERLYRDFVGAETRVWRERFRLDKSAAERLGQELWTIREEILERRFDPSTVRDGLARLDSEIREEEENLRSQKVKGSRVQRGRRFLLGIAGIFTIGTNTIVGTAAAPSTGGLSLAGAAVSNAAGAIWLERATRGRDR